ncbi:MAG: hypothetical protein IMF02_00510 [Proteobacteria bacterium]|nr:hypothetical protein [Pseudomonadota bacterium]
MKLNEKSVEGVRGKCGVLTSKTGEHLNHNPGPESGVNNVQYESSL